MLDRCQSCGRMYPTAVHQDCGQDLCDPCSEHHRKSGCSRPNFPPTRNTAVARMAGTMFPHHATFLQCLANLDQRESDGGRWEYLEQEARFRRSEPEMPTGDCAVVSLVHAKFRPTNGQSYRDSQFDLSTSTKPRMYKEQRLNEGKFAYFLRMIAQWWRPPSRNPIHGTPSEAMDWRLWLSGYKLIYPNEIKRWSCICDMECAYVLDIQMPEHHTMAVHQRVALTTALFDPVLTVVANVHRLDPERTMRLKALREDERRREQEEEERWRQSMAEFGYPDFNYLNPNV